MQTETFVKHRGEELQRDPSGIPIGNHQDDNPF